MLARHAEGLFWIGRYLERAEDTARMLDVTYHGALEIGTDAASPNVWAELLEVLYLEDEFGDLQSAAGEQVGKLLMADTDFPASIPALVRSTRENARGPREWLSAEAWEAINSLHLRMGRIELSHASQTQPYDVLRIVRSGCQEVTGSVEASMPRGEGHRFFTLGQRFERAMMTTRHVRVWRRRLADLAVPTAYAEWIKLLRAVSAYEAYLRDHRAEMEGVRVLQFLFQSTEFPRSVLHCLGSCERMLVSMAADGHGEESRRRIGKVRSELEFANADELGDLSFIEALEHAITDINSIVEADFFRPDAGTHMHTFEAF
jgi:uncharacterized alpha-E superfamily protein